MYNDYFGFTEAPFSIAPDPRYLYLSDQHREALAHLLYGINSNGGFILLTGEVGTGKTTVCRCLLEQVPENTEVAFILNPKYTVMELLAAICDELRIPVEGTEHNIKGYVDSITAHLLKSHSEGRHTVLIIDEAQNLGVDVLEQVRLLTNLETNAKKLLQIILLGQPELLEKLSRPELRQVAQRITARYHLRALSRKELDAYIAHRLSVAGFDAQLFPAGTLNRLYRLSRGIPRLINVLCDRALLGAYVQRDTRVEVPVLSKAAKEVFGQEESGGGGPLGRSRWWLGGSLAAVLAGTLAWNLPALSNWIDTASADRSVAVADSAPSGTGGDSQVLHMTAALYDEDQDVAPPETASQVVDASAIVPSSPANWLWPSHIDPRLSKVIAYRALFQAWGVDYDPKQQPIVCRFAREQGLDCLFLKGDAQSLRSLNRPAVLKLFNASGQEFYATLLGLEGERATLQVADQIRVVEIKDLELWWLRSYTVFWRLPPGYQGPLRPGMTGDNVVWLDRKLAQLQGRPPRVTPPSAYDEQLVRQVKQFQQSLGLMADGIVGPQTAIRINSLTAPPGKLSDGVQQAAFMTPLLAPGTEG